MANEVVAAIKLIAEEKGLEYEAVLETLQIALAAAYRKDFGNKQQNIEVAFDPESGDMKVADVKIVVPDMDLEKLAELAQAEATAREEAIEKGETPPEPDPDRPRFNPKTDLMLADAKEIKSDAAIGDSIRIDLEVPTAFGRMAAQTAKQVIMQKLREAERETIFSDFEGKQGEIVLGNVQRRDGRNILFDIGRATGVLTQDGQVFGERYEPGARYKLYVEAVEMGPKGPQIIVSRAHPDFVRMIFEMEIPEIASGIVQIKDVAREAGARSKVAVWTDEDGVDPVGACIGQRGTRIQTIINELGGEKIDIIQFEEDSEEYIRQALSPAKVMGIELKEEGEEKNAIATVAEDQFSLAIGKGGQNVRLAARLTGWKINVHQDGAPEEDDTEAEPTPDPEVPAEAEDEVIAEEVAEEKLSEEAAEESANVEEEKSAEQEVQESENAQAPEEAPSDEKADKEQE